MAEGVAAQDTRLARSAATVLVVAVGLRSLASIVAGFIELHDSAGADYYGRVRAADVLTTFGVGGDGTGILLAVAAAAAVWWCLRVGDGAAAALRLAVNWAFAIVAVLAILEAVGVGLYGSLLHQTGHTVSGIAFAVAYIVVAGGGIVLLQRYDAAVAELAFEDENEDIDAFIFAVDRKSGDVRAFLSARDAVRKMHIYWVEDDEFAFYTDEGVVLDASVVAERVVLRPTESVRPDELLNALKEFATRRGLKFDPAEADEPAAYAVPIARWQGLEMWPPWLRPLGLLFQPRH